MENLNIPQNPPDEKFSRAEVTQTIKFFKKIWHLSILLSLPLRLYMLHRSGEIYIMKLI